MLLEVLRWSQLLAAVGIVALLVRTAHILSMGPMSDMSTEVLYLRLRDAHAAGLLLFSVVLLEAYEYLYPWATSFLRVRPVEAWSVAMNGVQALLLLAAVVLVFLDVREYTATGQRRHIDATMSRLAEARTPQFTPEPELTVGDDEGEEEPE